MNKIAILGAGTWGIALARMLAQNGKEVVVWSALDSEIDYLKEHNCHPKLPDIQLPRNIVYTRNIEQACHGQDIILFAVASVFVRSTAAAIKDFISDGQIIVDVAKGIETDTLMTLTQVIEDELKNKKIYIAALSGPTHAEEVIRDLPTTIVAASENADIAAKVQRFFSTPFMRVYTNTDIHSVEICGAVKNIIALATGISAGLGYGDNAKAALITRGLAELTRLGLAMGGSIYTFSGLAGMGDLIVTCTSKHSRNNKAGYLIGKGFLPKDAVNKVGMVVEGINALPAAVKLAEKYAVDMPIVFAVNDVINNGVKPLDAVNALLNRRLRDETLSAD